MTARLGISLAAVSLRRGDKWVLRDISVRLKAGERWALIGGNGAGKTQFLKLLSTQVWPTPTGREKRIYRLGRRSVDLIEAKRRIAYVGAELQDKYARYGWNLRVRDLIATGLHRTDILLRTVTAEERRRVTATLSACGLRNHAARRFLSLSYGQKRTVLLARALVQEPDWLLLDEFYNGLDVDRRRRIDAILDVARARGQSWIASAHRAVDVPRGTRRFLELKGGRLRSVKITRGADAAGLVGDPVDRPLRLPKSMPHTPRGKRAGARTALLLRLSRADLFVDYRLVLRDLNWELRAGEHWAVFGANGAGKSSFLKLLYGDLSPALGGRIERANSPKGTPIASWKKRVGYVSPELQADYMVDVSVFELVASGSHSSIGLADGPTMRDRRIASRWLKFFGLLSVADCRPRELSYGQLRRALIARALAANPRILLLDEPLTGLDPRQRATMKRLLERLMLGDVTVIIAAHHAEDLPRGMTHALRLHNRRACPVDFHSAT